MNDLHQPLIDFAPQWGLVLGSGLGSLVDRVDVMGRLSFADVPEIPVSTVPGHAGQFVWGRLGRTRVVISQGRVHLYEGHPARAVTAGIRFMAAAGVRSVILTNAAGTLNPEFAPGSWMMISDHLNLTGTSPLLGGPNFIDRSEVYTRELRERFHAAAAEGKNRLHEGVYAGLGGPQYETPAEIRMMARLGADAVGMSTVLEAIEARALGLRVAGFSCLTNWAAGINPGPLDHSEVLSTGKAAADEFCSILERALGDYS